METKQFTFTLSFGFTAENKQEAINEFQKMLDDWEESILEAKSWIVDDEDGQSCDSCDPLDLPGCNKCIGS